MRPSITHRHSIPSIHLNLLPQPKELQFNEIMFNASDGSVDFIELVNTCDKAIQLQGLELLIDNDQQITQRILLCNEQKTFTQTKSFALVQTRIPSPKPTTPNDTHFINIAQLSRIYLQAEQDSNWH